MKQFSNSTTLHAKVMEYMFNKAALEGDLRSIGFHCFTRFKSLCWIVVCTLISADSCELSLAVSIIDVVHCGEVMQHLQFPRYKIDRQSLVVNVD